MIPDDQSRRTEESQAIARWQARFLRERGKKIKKENFSLAEKNSTSGDSPRWFAREVISEVRHPALRSLKRTFGDFQRQIIIILAIQRSRRDTSEWGLNRVEE